MKKYIILHQIYSKYKENIKINSCCGAGTAADTENVTKMVSSKLELQRLNENRNV